MLQIFRRLSRIFANLCARNPERISLPQFPWNSRKLLFESLSQIWVFRRSFFNPCVKVRFQMLEIFLRKTVEQCHRIFELFTGFVRSACGYVPDDLSKVIEL